MFNVKLTATISFEYVATVISKENQLFFKCTPRMVSSKEDVFDVPTFLAQQEYAELTKNLIIFLPLDVAFTADMYELDINKTFSKGTDVVFTILAPLNQNVEYVIYITPTNKNHYNISVSNKELNYSKHYSPELTEFNLIPLEQSEFQMYLNWRKEQIAIQSTKLASAKAMLIEYSKEVAQLYGNIPSITKEISFKQWPSLFTMFPTIQAKLGLSNGHQELTFSHSNNQSGGIITKKHCAELIKSAEAFAEKATYSVDTYVNSYLFSPGTDTVVARIKMKQEILAKIQAYVNMLKLVLKYEDYHMCSTRGPMYYLENTLYHAKQGKLEYARSCAVWPDAELTDFTIENLQNRFKLVMIGFYGALEEIFEISLSK